MLLGIDADKLAESKEALVGTIGGLPNGKALIPEDVILTIYTDITAKKPCSDTLMRRSRSFASWMLH